MGVICRRAWPCVIGLACLVLIALFMAPPALSQTGTDRTLLFGAWTPNETGLLGPSGVRPATRGQFDLRLLDRIGDHAEIGFVLVAMDRADVERALTAGEIDFALPEIGVAVSPTTRLSEPYRIRMDLLVLAAGAPRLASTGVEALRDALNRGLRIGVTREEQRGPEVAALLNDPRFAHQIVPASRTGDSLDRLLAGRLDGFLAVRLEAMEAIASRGSVQGLIETDPILIETHTLHLRFRTKRVDAKTIAHIDATILALRAQGVVAHLWERAITPVLLRLAAATRWFNTLDMLGTVAFALSGVLIARREAYSLLGAFVLAVLPAVGGGVMRDLLVGRAPIAILASPVPLLLVMGTVLGSFVLFRLFSYGDARFERLRRWERGRAAARRIISLRNIYEVTDALGLAAFTVVGVAVAVRYGAEPLWLWGPLCAALTGAGGGILRDVIRADSNNPALRTSIYAEVCLVWGLALSVMVDWLAREERPEYLRLAVIATVLGAFVTRMAVVLLRASSPRF
jgi:polar amino acid transport system substrate-binding protein